MSATMESFDNNVGAIASTEPVSHVEETPLLSHRRLVRSLSGAPHSGDIEVGVDTNNERSSEDYWNHLRDYIHRDEPTQVPAEEDESHKSQRTLGTVAGVFSPVTLSIFSALLFLRVGYLIGHAGLLETLLQFLISYIILVFTVTSVCAVSTNGAIEGGGCYFMISRTLGPEFGGSIGTIFCMANIVSSGLYLTGCAEGLVENFGPSGYLFQGIIPDSRWWRFLYGSMINLVNIAVCLIGAAAFAKAATVILGIVLVCLSVVIISFLVQPVLEVPIPEANHLVQNDTYRVNGTFTGFTTSTTLYDNLWPHYGPDYTSSDGAITSFATIFGVLFSGVTGIMAGANMSGELKDPSKSIPRGTLSAVGFTALIYVLVSLLTAATCTTFLLQNNYLFMMGICVWKPFVTVGIVTATWSASLTNLIGSSRVLAALAKDDIFGVVLKPVRLGIYKGNPWAALFVVAILVELCLLIGSLNLIAQLNSVLFLLSYCATNLACLMPELSCQLGFHQPSHYFPSGPEVSIDAGFKKGSRKILETSNYFDGHVKIGQTTDPDMITSSAEHAAWLDLITRLKIKAFVEATVSPSVREGMHHLIRLSGLGAMKPNTICLGFYDSHPQTDLLYSLRRESVSSLGANANLYPVRADDHPRSVTPKEYVAMVKDIIRLQKNVCLCRHFHTLDLPLIESHKNSMYMDVWPMNLFSRRPLEEFDTSSLFQLQLACILHMVPVWKDMELRVFILPTPENEEETKLRQKRLRNQLRQLRITARVVVAAGAPVDSQQPLNSLQINRLLLQNSTNTAVVFLYLPLPLDNVSDEEYLSALSTVSDSLPPLLFVHGVSPVTSTNL